MEARGVASNLCGAWLAFWPHMAARYGADLEKAYRAHFPDKTPKTAAQIIASVARSTMALMSAAVRADRSKSERRRFHCSAWMLESYRAGLDAVPEGVPAEETKRQRQNLARYWREHWKLLHLFQCVTQLALFPRSSRDWHANRESAEAASYTDRATDLFLEVAGRGGKYRPGLSRVARFELATAETVENFRHKFGEYAPGFGAEPAGVPGRGLLDVAAAEPEAEKVKAARLIPFPKVQAKLAAVVESFTARAAAGRLTPAEANEFLETFAPAVEIAARFTSSEDKEHGVSSEDSTENPSAKSAPISEEPNPVFAGNFEGESPVSADKNIRMDYSPLDVSPGEFLAAFYPEPREPVRLRFFGPKEVPRDAKGIPLDSQFSALKDGATRAAFDTSPGLLRKVQAHNKTRGVYFVVNAGGDKAEDITRVNAFFAEIDDLPMPEQHAKADACPLPPSIRNETKKSVHLFWPAAGSPTLEEFDEIQRRLIHYFKSDKKIKDRSRVMRLPGFNHVTYTDGLLSYKPVECVAFDPSRRYTAAEMLAAFSAPPEPPKPKFDFRPAKASESFEEFKRELGARIAAHESARRNGSGKWDCRGVCHNGKGATGLFYDPADNFAWCNAQTPCDLATIARAFGLEIPAAGSPHVGGRERGTI